MNPSKHQKKRLLLLNGSHSEIPLITAAKNLNFYVITTGNAPQLIGHQYSDEYHCADYSNKEEVLDLSRRLKIDAICSCANDFGSITAAYISEQLKLPGHDSLETTLLLNHKDRFKKFAAAHNIKTPMAYCYSDEQIAKNALNKTPLPCIVKPIDMTGGKGVSKVSTTNELIPAIQMAFERSPSKKIVIEEYIEGTQHSFSTFLINRRVYFSFGDYEYSPLNPFHVTTSAASYNATAAFREALIAELESIAALLKLTDGVLHAQVIANGNQYHIIELTRRCSGDLYPFPVSYAGDIDWGEWIVTAETGGNCNLLPKAKQQGFYGRHCIMAHSNGTVKNVSIDTALKPFIAKQIDWWKAGDTISQFTTEKLGVLCLQYPDEKVMLQISKQLNQLVVVEMEEETSMLSAQLR